MSIIDLMEELRWQSVLILADEVMACLESIERGKFVCFDK